MSYNFTVFHENLAVARVLVSDDHKMVHIEKLIPDGIMQPFSGDKLNLERVYNFLKERCYEDGYVGLEDVLKRYHMSSNNPWEWNKKTHGKIFLDKI